MAAAPRSTRTAPASRAPPLTSPCADEDRTTGGSLAGPAAAAAGLDSSGPSGTGNGAATDASGVGVDRVRPGVGAAVVGATVVGDGVGLGRKVAASGAVGRPWLGLTVRLGSGTRGSGASGSAARAAAAMGAARSRKPTTASAAEYPMYRARYLTGPILHYAAPPGRPDPLFRCS